MIPFSIIFFNQKHKSIFPISERTKFLSWNPRSSGRRQEQMVASGSCQGQSRPQSAAEQILLIGSLSALSLLHISNNTEARSGV